MDGQSTYEKKRVEGPLTQVGRWAADQLELLAI